MSKFSDRLNDARGKESIRAASKRAAKLGKVAESTLHPYFRAEHPRPTMPVVVALALALRIPTHELRELAGLPAEGEPWVPPAESLYMDDRQRRAVTELIRSFVKTQGASHADQSHSPAGSPPESDASTEVDEDQEAGRSLNEPETGAALRERRERLRGKVDDADDGTEQGA